MLHHESLRYVKASIICGFLAFLVSVGLFELGVFRGLDAELALFIEQPSPPVVGRLLQYALMLTASIGIAWTTIDIGRTSLKCAIALVALAECITAVWVADLFDRFFSPFATLLAIVLAFLFAFIYSQSGPGRRKQELLQLLGNRVSSPTFDTLLNCDVPLRFEGELREASVLVCEIFNHEELRGAMGVNDYVAMTNSFLRNSADLLVEQGGYLDESDGESLRVAFGIPLPDTKHAARACSAALELAERLDAVNKECKQVWGQMFDFRIGINSGEIVMAAYGSGRLGTLGISGESVEFARRLCAANIIYGSRILIGAPTFNLTEHEVEARPMELIQRSADAGQREEVYELLGRTGMLQPQDNLKRQHFWTGIVLYRSQQLDASLVEFRRAVEAAGSDGPSEFYIRRIEQMRAGHPTLDWNSARL